MPKYFVLDKNKVTVEKILKDYCYEPKWDGNNLIVSESLNDRITDILGNLLGEEIKKRTTFLPRYPFVCPNCKNESYAEPSIMMSMGLNIGSGTCKCGTYLHLEIEPDMYGDRMKAIVWDDFIKTQKIKEK